MFSLQRVLRSAGLSWPALGTQTAGEARGIDASTRVPSSTDGWKSKCGPLLSLDLRQHNNVQT